MLVVQFFGWILGINGKDLTQSMHLPDIFHIIMDIYIMIENQNLSNLLFPVCSHVNIPNSFIRTKIASVGSAVNST